MRPRGAKNFIGALGLTTALVAGGGSIFALVDRDAQPTPKIPHTGFTLEATVWKDLSDAFVWIEGVERHQAEVAAAEAQAAVDAAAARAAAEEAAARPTTTREASSSGNGVGAQPATPGSYEDTLACIKHHESDTSGGYSAQNPNSTASGAYQVLDTTWNGYAGYARAIDAPPEVQDQWAREAIDASGTRPWNGSGC